MQLLKQPESIITNKCSEPAGKKAKSKKVSKRRIERTQKVNWEIRDNQLAEKILSKANQINKNPRVRVSRTELARQVRALSLIQTKIDKLPKTKEIISKFEETKAKYRERISHHKIR